jgi:CxxC motif-containing protein
MNKPVPKTKLIEAAKALTAVRAKPPLRAGEVILPNLLNTGADVVATSALLSPGAPSKCSQAF